MPQDLEKLGKKIDNWFKQVGKKLEKQADFLVNHENKEMGLFDKMDKRLDSVDRDLLNFKEKFNDHKKEYDFSKKVTKFLFWVVFGLIIAIFIYIGQ